MTCNSDFNDVSCLEHKTKHLPPCHPWQVLQNHTEEPSHPKWALCAGIPR